MAVSRFDYALFHAKSCARRGNQLPHAKLDSDAVRAIRSNVRGLTAKQLAQQYGVHYRTVEKVRHRETWSHIK